MNNNIKLAGLAMSFALAGVTQADGIKWNTDLSKAMQIAKKTKKPIMIDFYADW